MINNCLYLNLENIMKFIKNIFKYPIKKDVFKRSYSQTGEDVIASVIFELLGVENGNYIDIGANHPIKFNNTFHFYEKGWRGYNIEPIQSHINTFNKIRPQDTNILTGIAPKSQMIDFYIMQPDTLSTFDPKMVEQYISQGYKIRKKKKIEFFSIEDLIKKINIDSLDLLNVDIEGKASFIIEDFIKINLRPKVIIIELGLHSPSLKEIIRDEEQIKTIINLGYTIYTDTSNNTIFVDKEIL